MAAASAHAGRHAVGIIMAPDVHKAMVSECISQGAVAGGTGGNTFLGVAYAVDHDAPPGRAQTYYSQEDWRAALAKLNKGKTDGQKEKTAG